MITQAEVQELIISECDNLASFLIGKNKSYGNSALEPINIFSKASAVEQIQTRIDDKLNRLKKGSEFQGDDTELDLIGYLVLLRIAKVLHNGSTTSNRKPPFTKQEQEIKDGIEKEQKLTGGGRLAV